VVTPTGAGRVKKRIVSGADSNATYGINDADIIYAEASVITSNRVYTLSMTGAGNGDEITFFTNDASQTISVSSVVLQAGAGTQRGVTFVFWSGAWHVKGVWKDTS
jgi:hypothetical protein